MRYDKRYFYKSKVEFEDCDMQGIVHHPKFLCFLERARLSALEEENIKYSDLINHDIGFAITDISTKFVKPLKFEDSFFVMTEIESIYKNYVKIYQTISSKIFDDKNLICDKNVFSHTCIRLCIINITDMTPVDITNKILSKLNLKENQGNIKDINMKHPYN
jgi:acyl-CoA thioester hydrolase